MPNSLRRSLSPLIVVAGPTGSGKSALALDIACRFDGEILNCDSLQVFRFFDIGTAKVPVEDLTRVPHHLLDACDPDQVFTAGDYSRSGRQVLHEIQSRGRLPIVSGGTGFYLRALVDGLAPGPQRDASLRERLTAREIRRPGSVHRILRRFDKETSLRIHPNDVPKVIRAVEICVASRKPAGEVFAQGRDKLHGFRILKIGLFPNRDALYERLDARVDHMFERGLPEEVRSILARGFSETVKPFESIGYKQALQLVKGDLSLKDALFYAKRDTRRYAKRQMTWFRQEPGIQILSGFGDMPEVRDLAMQRVDEFLRSAPSDPSSCPPSLLP